MAKKAEPQIKFTAVCMNCGILIPETKGIVIERKHYCENCAIIPQPVKAVFFAPIGLIRIICYLISIFPAAGFIFGAIFYSQPDADAKNFGKKCFIIMSVGIVLGLLFFMLVLFTGAALGSAVGGLNIKEGYY